VAGHRPVVLAGHSLGGLIAARYAPAHRDRVASPVLMDALEKAWAEGRRKWLRLSSRSKPVTAPNSGRYTYVDQPEVAVKAVQRVTAEAAG
jgi:pimeloyl-ACP methyl ester carboxylesterase